MSLESSTCNGFRDQRGRREQQKNTTDSAGKTLDNEAKGSGTAKFGQKARIHYVLRLRSQENQSVIKNERRAEQVLD